MIVSAHDTGVLELFWRHPVARRPSREAARYILSAVARQSGGWSLMRDWLVRQPRCNTWQPIGRAAVMTRLCTVLGAGNAIVLQHRSEPRWAGADMLATSLDRDVLLLSRHRTAQERDYARVREWLRSLDDFAEAQSVWDRLWIRYRRAPFPPLNLAEFRAEAERALKAGELIPVFHVRPGKTPAVVSESPAHAAPPGAAREREVIEDDPTFGGNHQADQQAATLVAAAATGAPFCEVCERARRNAA
jgi:hypothetical protein